MIMVSPDEEITQDYLSGLRLSLGPHMVYDIGRESESSKTWEGRRFGSAEPDFGPQNFQRTNLYCFMGAWCGSFFLESWFHYFALNSASKIPASVSQEAEHDPPFPAQ